MKKINTGLIGMITLLFASCAQVEKHDNTPIEHSSAISSMSIDEDGSVITSYSVTHPDGSTLTGEKIERADGTVEESAASSMSWDGVTP